jgi:hypothetical protein
MAFFTYKDLLDHLAGHAGKGVSATGVHALRTAAQAALRELPTHHEWTYYHAIGRVATTAPQTDGTLSYVESTRIATLTGATWPSWTVYGVLVIGDVVYEVESVTDSTHAVLRSTTTPGEDLTDVTYTLGRDTYTLAADFVSADSMMIATNSYKLTYRAFNDVVDGRRMLRGPGQPVEFTILGAQTGDGLMAIKLFPMPDQRIAIDYTYRRKPRDLVVDEENAGLVTTAPSSATLTGFGTSFSARHVGAIVRVGSDSKNAPTGRGGIYPYTAERRILSVESATSLTVDGVFATTGTKVRCVISDPVDVDGGSMEDCVYKLAERRLRSFLRMKPYPGEEGEILRCLAAARDADSRYTGSRQAGPGARVPRRLAEMPIVASN